MDAVHVTLLLLLSWKYKTKIAPSSFFIVQSKIVVKLLLFTESHEDGDEINLYPTLGSHKTMRFLLTIAKVVSVTRLFSEKKSIIHGRAGSSNLCGSQTFVLHKTHLQS